MLIMFVLPEPDTNFVEIMLVRMMVDLEQGLKDAPLLQQLAPGLGGMIGTLERLLLMGYLMGVMLAL